MGRAVNQLAPSHESWQLRSIHTSDPESGEYDVVDSAGEPVLGIQRINTDAGRKNWKANLQLVVHAPELQRMVLRQHQLLQRLLEAAGDDAMALRSAVQDAGALLGSIADSSLKTQR